MPEIRIFLNYFRGCSIFFFQCGFSQCSKQKMKLTALFSLPHLNFVLLCVSTLVDAQLLEAQEPGDSSLQMNSKLSYQ